MRHENRIETSVDMPIPARMKAWIPGDPHELILVEKPVPMPGRAEGAGQDRCGRDLCNRSGNGAVKRLVGAKGADYVIECAGTEDAVDEAIQIINRGGKICLAAFPHDPVTVDLPNLVRNNVYLYGIRGEGKSATHRAMGFMREKRFDASLIHTHAFSLDDLPTALRYARDRVDDAIKVLVKAGRVEPVRRTTD